jgi:hypothetical protein
MQNSLVQAANLEMHQYMNASVHEVEELLVATEAALDLAVSSVFCVTAPIIPFCL